MKRKMRFVLVIALALTSVLGVLAWAQNPYGYTERVWLSTDPEGKVANDWTGPLDLHNEPVTLYLFVFDRTADDITTKDETVDVTATNLYGENEIYRLDEIEPVAGQEYDGLFRSTVSDWFIERTPINDDDNVGASPIASGAPSVDTFDCWPGDTATLTYTGAGFTDTFVFSVLAEIWFGLDADCHGDVVTHYDPADRLFVEVRDWSKNTDPNDKDDLLVNIVPTTGTPYNDQLLTETDISTGIFRRGGDDGDLGFENDAEDYNFEVTNTVNTLTATYGTLTDTTLWCEDVLLFDDADGNDVIDITHENVLESVFKDSYDTIALAEAAAVDSPDDFIMVRKTYGSDAATITLSKNGLYVKAFDLNNKPKISVKDTTAGADWTGAIMVNPTGTNITWDGVDLDGSDVGNGGEDRVKFAFQSTAAAHSFTLMNSDVANFDNGVANGHLSQDLTIGPNNTFSGGAGFYLEQIPNAGASGYLITQNTFDGAKLLISSTVVESSDWVSIVYNDFSEWNAIQLCAEDTATIGATKPIEIHYNRFVGNTDLGIWVGEDIGSGKGNGVVKVNADRNWWGATSGPYAGPQPSWIGGVDVFDTYDGLQQQNTDGTGSTFFDDVNKVGSLIYYRPWLNANPTALGPDTVDPTINSGQTVVNVSRTAAQGKYFWTISEALAHGGFVPGDTIQVSDGTYTRDLEVLGTDIGKEVKIQAASDPILELLRNQPINVVGDFTALLKGFRIVSDGSPVNSVPAATGRFTDANPLVHAQNVTSFTLEDSRIDNFDFSGGVGLEVEDDNAAAPHTVVTLKCVTIQRCNIGILVHGVGNPTLYILPCSWNFIQDNGAIGMQIGANVTGCSIEYVKFLRNGDVGTPADTGALTVANHDNDVHNCWFVDNVEGFLKASDTSGVVENVAVGNDDITGNLDAINNWWGHASGPYNAVSNPGGLGQRIDDNILFDPWIGAVSHTYSNANWNLVSVPYDPQDPDPAVVFDEVIGATLYEAFPYDSYDQALTIDPQQGYWLYLAGSTTVAVEGTPKVSPVNLVLGQANKWYLISVPFFCKWMDKVGTEGVEVVGGGVLTDVLYNGYLYPWYVAAQAYSTVYDPTSAYVMSAWYGFWVKTTAACTLRFYKSPTPPAPTSALGLLQPMGIPVTSDMELPPAPPSLTSGTVGLAVAIAQASDSMTFFIVGTGASAVAEVSLAIYDLAGSLVYQTSTVGAQVAWGMNAADGAALANGVYLFQLVANLKSGQVIPLELGRLLILR